MAIPLILAPIVSMLAGKGLDLLGGAISGSLDKGVDYIEEKTGIKIDNDKSSAGLSNQEVERLTEFQRTHELELQQLALNEKKEDNRHNEELEDNKIEKYSIAHNSYDKHSEATDKLSSQIMKDNLIIIGVLVLLQCGIIYFLKEYAELIAVVSGLIGAVINSLLSERQSVVNFRFGSSIGSKLKDKK